MISGNFFLPAVDKSFWQAIKKNVFFLIIFFPVSGTKKIEFSSAGSKAIVIVCKTASSAKLNSSAIKTWPFSIVFTNGPSCITALPASKLKTP